MSDIEIPFPTNGKPVIVITTAIAAAIVGMGQKRIMEQGPPPAQPSGDDTNSETIREKARAAGVSDE